MSVETIERLHRDFTAGVDEACAAGKGPEHLIGYFRATGRDCAHTVFLKMIAEMESASDTTAEVVFEWLSEFPEAAVNLLATGIRDSLAQFGLTGSAFAEETESAAVTEFAERLDHLFEASQPGGSA
ncbi:hypothetical protein [Lichenifustis flavocetrariae]|uniref:Uncharacterized protein n=1 Tax=Lichenifustis flavocetrariae TaxID=2949735 RepID=A0AA42CH50_9HYPH|nr:hypothetical protein [Lichenifustis flavocetrariae]MCW6506904.1 hypothetical protein [Lichenifustis flavocetrariae]